MDVPTPPSRRVSFGNSVRTRRHSSKIAAENRQHRRDHTEVATSNSQSSDGPQQFFHDLLQEAKGKSLNKRRWYGVARELAHQAGRADFIVEATFYNWFGKRDRVSDWEWSHSVCFVVYAAVGEDETAWKPWRDRWEALRKPRSNQPSSFDSPNEQGEQQAVSRAVTAPRQLPPPPGYFVGRRDVLARLTTALDHVDPTGGTVVISAMTGMGGVGKTWLALQWAHQHRDLFPDGELFVDLGGFSPSGESMSPSAAVRVFIDAFNVESGAIPPDFEAQVGLYRSLVANKRMLIVLDNARDSAHIASLLPGSPTSTVLITSRDKLVALSTTQGINRLDLDMLSEREAYELLANRLGQPKVQAEPAAVTTLIACCGGLPLALGIVAGRAASYPTFPLATWADELQDSATRLNALDAGDPAASLTAVLSWSTAALTAEQIEAFSLLGLTTGPDISTAAVASLTGLPASRAKVVLESLERVSLLQQHTPGRWQMHDLIRLYAKDQAVNHQPKELRETALRRLVDFYLHTTYVADQLLDPHRESIELNPPAPGCDPYPLHDATEALAWLDCEHPCVLAAQRLAIDLAWNTVAWQTAPTLHTYHWRRGRLSDQVLVSRAGLAAAQHLDDPAILAQAHRLLAEACALAGQHAEALDHLNQALTLAVQADDLSSQAHTHRVLAWAWGQQGQIPSALRHAIHSLELFQGLNNHEWEARGLNQTAWYSAQMGNYEEAQTRVEAALNLHRRHHNHNGEALSLSILGYIALHTGQYPQALDYGRQALNLHRSIGNSYHEADTLNGLGHVYLSAGQYSEARDAWQQAVQLYQIQNRKDEARRAQQQLNDLSAAESGTDHSDN